jgi:hypothetical protein
MFASQNLSLEGMGKCGNLEEDCNGGKDETTICRHHITCCWITGSTICTRRRSRRSCSCVHEKLVGEKYISLKIDKHGKASWTDTGASHRVHKECNRLLHLQWGIQLQKRAREQTDTTADRYGELVLMTVVPRWP